MAVRIALFRGINVGGRNILPMAKLREGLESLGFEQVRSYIQSGNVVFEAQDDDSISIAERIGELVERQHGFRPEVLVIGNEDLRAAIERNPFRDETSDPKSIHFLFLAAAPVRPAVERLERIKSDTERFHLTDQVFYLHAPDGIARSKLAASAERHLGVVATGRNYRTVVKLLSLADEIEANTDRKTTE